jgi:hypothetical protein
VFSYGFGARRQPGHHITSSTSFEYASTRSIQALLMVIFGASEIWLPMPTLGLGASF